MASVVSPVLPSVRGRRQPVGDELRLKGVPAPMLAAWVALFANVLAFAGIATVIPIPRRSASCSLKAPSCRPLAGARRNPGVVVRPNLFLVLLTMLAVVALMVSIHNEFILWLHVPRLPARSASSAVLWFLTPWWGRSDFALLRAHLAVLARRARHRPGRRRSWRPAWRSPTVDGFRARYGRFRPLRWPTTPPSSSVAPS